MNKNLKVSKSIEINSKGEQVWDALTNPEKIKVYLFGTETITNWKVGSPIIFQGEYEGHKYKDKGNVLKNELNSLLQYNYWSQFSSLEDTLENYAIVTYKIGIVSENKVNFTWTQEGFSSQEGFEHTEKTLNGMLEQIKNLVEEKA